MHVALSLTSYVITSMLILWTDGQYFFFIYVVCHFLSWMAMLVGCFLCCITLPIQILWYLRDGMTLYRYSVHVFNGMYVYLYLYINCSFGIFVRIMQWGRYNYILLPMLIWVYQLAFHHWFWVHQVAFTTDSLLHVLCVLLECSYALLDICQVHMFVEMPLIYILSH